MPPFRYTGPPGMYPQGRDTLDHPIGAVDTGDVRDLAEAPDTAWVSCEAAESEPDPAPAAPEPDPEPEPEPAADTSEQDDNEAGQPGSEEH